MIRAALSTLVHVSCVMCLYFTIDNHPSLSPPFLHSNHSHLHLQCFQNPFLFGLSKIGMFGTQTYTRGIDFLLSKKHFLPSLSPSSTMFSKTFPFWIIKTRDCLVLKLTREVLIYSLAKTFF